MTATRGPCAAWDPIWCCDISSFTPALTGQAALAATEVLYNLSGQIFDVCEFTVRPCRHDCQDWGAWGGGFGGYGIGNWWQWGGLYPRPYLFDGAWFNLACGQCVGSCSCTALCEAWLPGPVNEIVSVKLDGQTLPASGYRVDDFRKLIRLGGECWPMCQDMSLADTEANTWSVTVRIGENVPTIGQYAVGELACEIARSCAGLDCALPKNATSITRQGVTIDFALFTDLLENGLLGLKWTDIFISTYNPHRLKAPPMVYDVDGEQFRRAGT